MGNPSLLNTAYNLLYHQFAWLYDAVAAVVSIGSWQDWVYSIESELSGPNVLEIGFGPGHLIGKLQCSGVNSFGIDASWQMCKAASRRFNNRNLPSHLVYAVAQALPFRNAYFNQVVATFPGNYIFEGVAWREIERVLTGRGRVIILLNAQRTGNNILSVLSRKILGANENTRLIVERLRPSLAAANFSYVLREITLDDSKICILQAAKK